MTEAQWRVSRIRSRTVNISSPWIAKDPACPEGPHPMRWCQCHVFRTQALADAYVESKR